MYYTFIGIHINQDDLEIYEIIQNSKIIQNLLQYLNLKDKGSDNLISYQVIFKVITKKQTLHFQNCGKIQIQKLMILQNPTNINTI